MILGTEFRKNHYVRVSKKGKTHTYSRNKTVLVIRCDCCQEVFERDKGSMDPNRLNDGVYHVCGNCDSKKFAQSKGVEARRIWDIPVSSLKTIDQL
jgi:hypothetical protein